MVSVVVAGGGIVGLSCAIWAQRAGHQVTLIDRAGDKSSDTTMTSYGNAGLLAAAALVPVPTPGIWRKAPGMLLDKNKPLFLRWAYLPKVLPFLLRFLSKANKPHMDHYARNMSYLMSDAYAQHMALAKDTRAESFVHDNDYATGYVSDAEYQADVPYWNHRRAHGVSFEVLSGDDYAKVDPIYAGKFHTVVVAKNQGRISDPGAYVAALLQHFVDEGGTVFQAEVSDVEIEGDTCTAVITDLGRIAGDVVVLALGAWSGRLAEKMGARKLSFETERGYHIELLNPSDMPVNPMMSGSGKFGITPMEGRLRLAGTVEFGGLTDARSRAPLDYLKRYVEDMFPDLEYEEMTEWMGRRPSTSDSLPIIGPTSKQGGYLAFGHQHLGLTAGPKTGRLIADMISDVPSNADLSAFAADRYT